MKDLASGNVDVRAADRIADEQPAFTIGGLLARVVSPIVIGVVELEEMPAVRLVLFPKRELRLVLPSDVGVGELAARLADEDRRRISVVCARLGAKHGELQQRVVLVVERRAQAIVGVFIAREQVVHIQLGPKAIEITGLKQCSLPSWRT